MLVYLGETPTPTSSFLEINNIPTTYESLVIKGQIGCTGTTEANAYMFFNGITTSTYRWMAGGRNTAGTTTTENSASTNEGMFARSNPDAGFNVGTIVAPVEIEFWSYRGDQPGNMGWYSLNGLAAWDGSHGGNIMFVNGVYTEDQSVDVTRIQFITSQGSWSSHTKLYLYGRTSS